MESIGRGCSKWQLTCEQEEDEEIKGGEKGKGTEGKGKGARAKKKRRSCKGSILDLGDFSPRKKSSKIADSLHTYIYIYQEIPFEQSVSVVPLAFLTLPRLILTCMSDSII